MTLIVGARVSCQTAGILLQRLQKLLLQFRVVTGEFDQALLQLAGFFFQA